MGVHPEGGVESPSPAVGAVEALAASAIEANDGPPDVAEGAVFCAADCLAVAKKGDVAAVNADDAVEHIEARTYFCQYGVADLRLLGFGKEGFVAVVLEEGSHADTPQAQGDGVSFVEQTGDFRQQTCIFKLHLFGFYCAIA